MLLKNYACAQFTGSAARWCGIHVCSLPWRKATLFRTIRVTKWSNKTRQNRRHVEAVLPHGTEAGEGKAWQALASKKFYTQRRGELVPRFMSGHTVYVTTQQKPRALVNFQVPGRMKKTQRHLSQWLPCYQWVTQLGDKVWRCHRLLSFHAHPCHP